MLSFGLDSSFARAANLHSGMLLLLENSFPEENLDNLKTTYDIKFHCGIR